MIEDEISKVVQTLLNALWLILWLSKFYQILCNVVTAAVLSVKLNIQRLLFFVVQVQTSKNKLQRGNRNYSLQCQTDRQTDGRWCLSLKSKFPKTAQKSHGTIFNS